MLSPHSQLSVYSVAVGPLMGPFMIGCYVLRGWSNSRAQRKGKGILLGIPSFNKSSLSLSTLKTYSRAIKLTLLRTTEL